MVSLRGLARNRLRELRRARLSAIPVFRPQRARDLAPAAGLCRRGRNHM